MQFTCLGQFLFKEKTLTLIQIVPVSKSPLAGRKMGACVMSLFASCLLEAEYMKKNVSLCLSMDF